ncbi:hypothetical protein MHU86_713 [Fragilaria crotonensis]|nr:hypothetical protein MHU86_713 [Fragilaria crotonensis]
MNRQGDWEGRCPSGGAASGMPCIQPTDIMLGRGPTCYNNAGNIMFRKLLKEYELYYRKQARRSEKAALVKLLVSKLKAKGCRFLCRSAPGVWVEASTQVAERKMGHGLRDARLDAGKILPKNFRPATTEQKHAERDSVMPVLTGEAKNQQEIHHTTLEYTALSPEGADPQYDGYPSKIQRSVNDLIRDREVQLLDEDVPFFPNESIHVASVLQEYPLLDEGQEKKGLSFLDCEIEGDFKHRDGGGDANRITEPRHARLASSSNHVIEERLDPMEQNGEDRLDTPALPEAPASARVTHEVHVVVNAVDMALNMCSFSYEEASRNWSVDDPYERFGDTVEDAESLCRWFSNLS